MAGLVLATAGAFWPTNFDDRLRDRAAIAKATQTCRRWPSSPATGVPPARAVVSPPSRDQPEAVRGLRATVQFAALSAPVQSLMVTSSRPRKGKSTVAASLAVAFAATAPPRC
ncbi:MAG: hypothetical protein R2755_28055 [Acidimicrobiales bacterium]